MQGFENKQVIIVSGMSGSGKSTALKVFEDMGFFCVDGLPARMAPELIKLFFQGSAQNYTGLAIGMDLRQPDFVLQWREVLDEIHNLSIKPSIIFTDSSTPVLLRRYATTRRPHPLATKNIGLEEAIARERTMLAPILKQATLPIDTSPYSVHDLRRFIQKKWDYLLAHPQSMRVHLISFGFKYGTPAEADAVTDLRFLCNPYFEEDLRPLSGLDEPIARYVLEKEPGPEYLRRLLDFLDFTLPLYVTEGRYRLTMAFGCTGGRHRSVAVTEAVQTHLIKQGYSVSVEHRHLSLG